MKRTVDETQKEARSESSGEMHLHRPTVFQWSAPVRLSSWLNSKDSFSSLRSAFRVHQWVKTCNVPKSVTWKPLCNAYITPDGVVQVLRPYFHSQKPTLTIMKAIAGQPTICSPNLEIHGQGYICAPPFLLFSFVNQMTAFNLRDALESVNIFQVYRIFY